MQPQPSGQRAQYRKRDKTKKTTRVTFSVSESTIQGLNTIRELFKTRYPQDAFPTLSLVLETVLAKNIDLFERKPSELVKAVEEFKVKYPNGTKPRHTSDSKPATIQEDQGTQS